MFTDINTLTVSQPRLPKPTPCDGSLRPFREWASELRPFLDINGFQYIPQMDVAFREDAPIQLHHLVLELKLGQQHKMPSPPTRRPSMPCVKSWQMTIAQEPTMSSTTTLQSSRLTALFIGLTSMRRSAKLKEHQTISLTSWFIQPRQHQSQIITFIVFIKVKKVLNLGDFFVFVAARDIVLLQNILASCWTEQHQHHQFRTWIEDMSRYESESGTVIDKHKIATTMNHLCGSIREHLLVNSKPSRPGINNMAQQDDINVIKKKGEERQRKGQR